jgi:hypothetical protein
VIVVPPSEAVKVAPGALHEVTARGAAGATSVKHVVSRSEDKKIVIHPLSKDGYTEHKQERDGCGLHL